MNLEEYRRRIEDAHTVTGVPTYWVELQEMIAERDRYQYIAKMFYDNRFAQDPDQTQFAADSYEEAAHASWRKSKLSSQNNVSSSE
jgi:hypothetical protein